MKLAIKHDLLMAGALSVLGVLARAPYLAFVPVFEDEMLQTVYALSIRPGEFMPLVGNDPYTGPAFAYILAACLRLFGVSAVAPRIVVMVMGALTVGMTYFLARAFGLKPPWAALVGLLMAANPQHILISSHYAGATYALPFFSTAFLLALALAVKRESGVWLVVAGALMGIAMQASPIVALMLPGVVIWFVMQCQARQAIGLRTRWPYLALLALVLTYAPVIAYNIQTGFSGFTAASAGRSYLWQPNPSPQAFVQNFERLALQLCRQVSGVLEGDETVKSLVGLPLLLSAWAATGMIYAARRGIGLPLLAVGSQLLIMPWLSNHYGLTGTTRFTNQLTPLMFAAMGSLGAGLWGRLARAGPNLRPKAVLLIGGLLLAAISLWPLTSLFRYYDHAVARGETNARDLAFFDGFVRQWPGDTVWLSDSPTSSKIVVYFLAVNHVPYDAMPAGRIMERLASGQVDGRITLILYDEDLARAGTQADLAAWEINALKTGYGAYTIADARQVRKPSFVYASATAAPAVRPVQASFDQLDVIGYDVKPDKLQPGAEFVVNVHWQAKATMSEAYTGFVHLIGPDGQLVTQDDHELGRDYYRTLVWQLGEVIREKYTLTLPKDAPTGDYTLHVGAYSFPSLQRLTVRSATTSVQDNAIVLGAVHVGP